MNPPSIQEVQERLERARNTPHLRRQFPKELWEDIFALIDRSSPSEVANQLGISPSFLRRKSKAKKGNRESKKPTFQEIPLPPSPSEVIIEISKKELKARIEGPPSCLPLLLTLFKEK